MLRTHASTVREVNIVMPLLTYDGFVDKCDQAAREYAVLKNGLIHRRVKGDHYERVIEIRCDLEDANKLLTLGVKIYPDSVSYIRKGIAAALKAA